MTLGRWITQSACWAIACASVAGAHVAAFQYLTRVDMMVPQSPIEAPVFVDLAPVQPMEKRVLVEEAPDPEPVEQEPVPTPDPKPKPVPKAVEVPDFVTPPIVPLSPLTEFVIPSPLRLTQSDRPLDRPRRQPRPETSEPMREEPRRTPPEPARQDPPRETRSASAAPSQPQRQQAGATRQQMQGWHVQARARVSRHMARTQVRGVGATVQLSVSVSASGSVSARLVSSTGDSRIDAAIARQAARLPNLPPPPAGALTFLLPIAFQ